MRMHPVRRVSQDRGPKVRQATCILCEHSLARKDGGGVPVQPHLARVLLPGHLAALSFLCCALPWSVACWPGCVLAQGSTGLSGRLHDFFPSRVLQERLGPSRLHPLWAPVPGAADTSSALGGVRAQWQLSTPMKRCPAAPGQGDSAWRPGCLCPLHLPHVSWVLGSHVLPVT